MKRDGYSLIELLVAITIAGVLLGSAVMVLRTEGIAVSQAASALAANLNRTRFQAIESNRTAFLTVDTEGAGAYTVWVDEDDDGTLDDGEARASVQFGAGELGRLTLGVSNLPASGAIRFDRRGIPLDPVATTVFTLASGKASRQIALSSTGRPDIQ